MSKNNGAVVAFRSRLKADEGSISPDNECETYERPLQYLIQGSLGGVMYGL